LWEGRPHWSSAERNRFWGWFLGLVSGEQNQKSETKPDAISTSGAARLSDGGEQQRLRSDGAANATGDVSSQKRAPETSPRNEFLESFSFHRAERPKGLNDQ
jgi:hypothetical protein